MLVAQVNQQRLRALGFQLAQRTAQLRRRRRRRVFGKDDWWSVGAVRGLVLDKQVDVLQAEVGEASSTREEIRKLRGGGCPTRCRFLFKDQSSKLLTISKCDFRIIQVKIAADFFSIT
jgi:hypothetical protein